MADKSVGELIAAQSVTPTDLFVLEQSGTAKKLTGQILENWLVSFADGHGGIQSIAKVSTSGLADTYRITLADATTFDFVVTNGKGVENIQKTSTSGLVDTYTISYNDGPSSTFTVTNGAKGDKGDTAYIWIKYASQEPNATSHSFGDIPDDWIGVYFGFSATAPTNWEEYKWYQIKGEKGDTGEPATLVSSSVTYQVGDSGTIIPSGNWSGNVPPVTPGWYLWTRQVLQFNTGAPITNYSVSRFGIDGAGSVSSVAGISPNADGNVPLTASDVGALPSAGGDMTGELNMNGQKLSGLNAPTSDTEAATKGYVDTNKVDKNQITNTYLCEDPGFVPDARALKRLHDKKVDIANVVNNFTTTASGYVADARALKTLNDKFNMNLLWTNASPTSTFAPQNITLDVSQYKLLLFQFRPCASYELLDTALCVKGQRGWLSSITGSAGQAGAYAFTVWRQIAVNSTGDNNVVIYTGYKNGKNNMVPEEENNYAVPYRIYGIRGGAT